MIEKTKSPSLRERMKEQTRDLILAALMGALARGAVEETTHDALARAVGVSKMTVYRYFPDRQALMQAMWQKATETVGPEVRFPRCEADLLDGLQPIYTGFDRNPAVFTLTLSTAQGRALRLAMKEQRVAAYTEAAADAVAALPEPDRKLATAMLQALHASYVWLEMRDQWDLSGEEIARATHWAMRTLLADLRHRGDRGLDEDGPEAAATAQADRKG